MNITIADKKLSRAWESPQLLQKQYGHIRAKKITLRLNALNAAPNLHAMRQIPGRCHELTGDRTGQFALDLDHPYRLIFVPNHQPIPRKADGGINWQEVTSVTIIAVEDYHK